MKRRSLWVKLGIFVVISAVLGVMEFNTLTGPHVGTTHEYHAVFGGPDGVSGLRTGDPVKVSGVGVGKVTGERLLDANHVEVSFTANERQTLTDHTWAVVRYANLLGQRFLALTQSAPGGTPLRGGGTIPASRTAPALSLTALFNGFRPLFQGLTPQQVNELSNEIIAVLQGQQTDVEDLISKTADLTTNLAQRDQVFTQVVDSLSSLLSTVASHDDQLTSMLIALHALSAQLDTDGPAILDSAQSVDGLLSSVAGLLGKLDNHNLPGDISSANAVAGVLAQNSAAIEQLLGGFVTAFSDFARVSQNGNWVNVYPCVVYATTYGRPVVTAQDMVQSLADTLGPQLAQLLGKLGLGATSLAALALPIPVTVPVGQAGDPSKHTGVCK
jgi:phospholipid/cholesterol/gamma-HCH transport system substrate-binding protein